MLTKSNCSNEAFETTMKFIFISSHLPHGSGIHWVKIDKDVLYYMRINDNRYSGKGRPRNNDYDIRRCAFPCGSDIESEILYPYDAIKEDYTKIYKGVKNEF